MRHVRIFLSSPGDVAEERDHARDLIKNVLPFIPFVRDRATFDVISWDDPHASPGLSAHLAPQIAVNKRLRRPSECDIVVVILWGRMGTPLTNELKGDDGTTYISGTEWEFDDALNAARECGRPEILLYRRIGAPQISLDDPDIADKQEQYQRVQEFFSRFRGSDASLTGSFHPYKGTEQFRELLRQHLESLVNEIIGDGFSKELGVTRAAVANMLRILEEQQVPPEELNAKLHEIAERHLALAERLHFLSKSNDEPKVAEKREQAAAAVESGNYDQASALLTEAVIIDRHSVDEQQAALDRRKVSAATTLNQLGQLDHTRLNYRQAAKHFAEAATLLPIENKGLLWAYAMDQANALYDQGREFGDNSALIEAISIYEKAKSYRVRRDAPSEWAKTSNDLGNALQTLGRRENGTERLNEAVAAYRSALEDWTQERAPLNWAKAQNGLGLALQGIGERESGTERLREAIDSYHNALQEWTRERAPLDWAKTQNNLGLALQTLGKREISSTTLREAVTAFHNALLVWTREKAPLSWALAMSNLGDALRALGEREQSANHLKEAIDAYKNALQERTRDRVPLHWAHTQNNLGATLQILGERENDINLLERSKDSYQNSLLERTRDRVPLDWAQTQSNLGDVLRAIGERQSGTETLEQAINAFESSLEELTRDHAPLQWARTHENLGCLLTVMASRRMDLRYAKRAIRALEGAMDVYSAASASYDIRFVTVALKEAREVMAELAT